MFIYYDNGLFIDLKLLLGTRQIRVCTRGLITTMRRITIVPICTNDDPNVTSNLPIMQFRHFNENAFDNMKCLNCMHRTVL